MTDPPVPRPSTRRSPTSATRPSGSAARHGHTAGQLRSLADGVGLKVVLEHVGYDRIRNGWDQAIEDVRTLGTQWIVIPSLPGSLHSPDGSGTWPRSSTRPVSWRGRRG